MPNTPSRLTDNFVLSEFAVSSSFPELVRPVPAVFLPKVRRLAVLLEGIRAKSGHPIRILSGYRPPALNREVGGSPTSQHLSAEAVDIRFIMPTGSTERLGLVELAVAAADLVNRGSDVGQVIVYPLQGFVHIALPSPRYPHSTLDLNKPPAYRYSRISGGLNALLPLL